MHKQNGGATRKFFQGPQNIKEKKNALSAGTDTPLSRF